MVRSTLALNLLSSKLFWMLILVTVTLLAVALLVSGNMHFTSVADNTIFDPERFNFSYD